MNTNFQMLKELNANYHPVAEGFISEKEQHLIKETLCLAEMNVLALRNLRDFTVMFFGKLNTTESSDKMSAIVYMIDREIFAKGGEV